MCKDCSPGHYSWDGASACTACTAGWFQSDYGATSCSQCEAGAFSSAASSACSLCPINTFQKQRGAPCTRCPPQQSTEDRYGQTQCTVDACLQYDSCSACTGEAPSVNCGWCPTDKTCRSGGNYNAFSTTCTSWQWTPGECDACNEHSDSTTCLHGSQTACGWCDQSVSPGADGQTCASGLCSRGSASGSSNPYCAYDSWQYYQCDDNTAISGSHSFATCYHDNMYTCGGMCCCHTNYQPDSQGNCNQCFVEH